LSWENSAKEHDDKNLQPKQ